MPAVQKIACVNDGGYVMSFSVEVNGTLRTASSGNFPLGSTKTIDLGPLGIAEGANVWPVIDIVLGKTVSGPTVQYAANGQTATYQCKGTTLDPKITLLGADAAVEAEPATV